MVNDLSTCGLGTAVLSGCDLTLETLAGIATGDKVELDLAALQRMQAARDIVDAALASGQPVYGVTTGLGPKVTHSLSESSIDAFSLNTIRGRAHAVGTPLHRRLVRAGMVVRANTLLTGAAGARPTLALHIADCLNASLTPVIPETGTIGVADLCWGGAFGLALIGEGNMQLPDGTEVNAQQAMTRAGIEAFKPMPREGLALVSHSCLSAGLAGIAIKDALDVFEAVQTSAALSMEGFRANLSPLDSRVLAIRPQSGQQEVAAGLHKRLDGSALYEAGQARRLQDPLSIRNIVQVHGAACAMLQHARDAVTTEINAASDNPAVVVESADILSHGGYLPPYLCICLSAAAQSLVHLSALQVSRIAKLLFARFTDLTDGLTHAGAEGAGFSPVLKTAEALFAEIAQLATPPTIYPGISADGLEDVVTHTVIPARSLISITTRLSQLTAIEALVAAQAVDLRKPAISLSPALQSVHGIIRQLSAPLEHDRPLGHDIELLAERIGRGAFSA